MRPVRSSVEHGRSVAPVISPRSSLEQLRYVDGVIWMAIGASRRFTHSPVTTRARANKRKRW